MKNKIFKIDKQTYLRQAYEEGVYAIDMVGNYGFQELDEALRGSSLTEELNEILEKTQNKMTRLIEKRFKEMGLIKLKD
jgi:hypothetical protein